MSGHWQLASMNCPGMAARKKKRAVWMCRETLQASAYSRWDDACNGRDGHLE